MYIELAGNIDDNMQDVLKLASDLGEVYAREKKAGWRIRCTQCRYLGPWAVALLAGAYFLGENRNQSPRIVLPTEPLPLAAYCHFSGMKHMFANGPLPDRDHPESETIPIDRFYDATWNRPDGIIRLLQRHTSLSIEREDQIRTCVQEVAQNIHDHAGSVIGGVMSARYMAQSQEVRVGIVDHGFGIAEVLGRKHPEVTTSKTALERVIEGGYTSRSRPNNMGQGVSNLFGLVRLARGRVVVITGNAVANSAHGEEARVTQLDMPFPGTAVFFALPCSMV
jgi:hypothetical protein